MMQIFETSTSSRSSSSSFLSQQHVMSWVAQVEGVGLEQRGDHNYHNKVTLRICTSLNLSFHPISQDLAQSKYPMSQEE